MFEKEKLEDLKRKLEGQDFYQRLGLPRTASPEEIKRRYYEIVLNFNPANKPKDLQEICSQIIGLYAEAKNTLHYPDRRKVYDLKFEKRPSPMEAFKMEFIRARMQDRMLNKSARQSFDDVRKIFSGKLTEEDMQKEREKWIAEGTVTKEDAVELQVAA